MLLSCLTKHLILLFVLLIQTLQLIPNFINLLAISKDIVLASESKAIKISVLFLTIASKRNERSLKSLLPSGVVFGIDLSKSKNPSTRTSGFVKSRFNSFKIIVFLYPL